MNDSTVLITGGASGIGLAMAQRFVRAGSTVIVCGRRAEQLEIARRACPELHTLVSDVSSERERIALSERVLKEFPAVDVLVNNAGVQNRPPHLTEPQDWAQHRLEVAINLEAPMHLSMLFLPAFRQRKSATIVNVSSGLAFFPISRMSTYCATKAALHSFTMSLRYQLKDTPIEVVEVIPPAVDTDLGGKGLHTQGVPLEPYADDVMARLAEGETEFGYQLSDKWRWASRKELDELFVTLNGRFEAQAKR